MDGTITFTWYSISTLLGTLVSIALSIFVFINVKKSSPHIFYSAVLFCMGIWCLDSFLVSIAPNNVIALMAARIFHLGGIYSSFFFILWVFGIDNNKAYFYKLYKLFAVTMVGLLTFLNFKSFILLGDINSEHFFIPFHSIGKYYPIFVSFLFLNGFVGCLELYGDIRRAISKIKKIQLTYILLATIVMYIAGTTYYLFIYNLKVMPIADIFVVLSNLVITYAILRHQLLDIEVIIKKTLVFAGLFIASYGVFASFAYLGSVLFENVVQNRWIALVPSVFVIVLILRPLESFLRNTTDKYLFQKRYDYRHLLKTFADEVLTVLDLEMLVNLTVNKLVEIIKLENASILLSGEESGGSRIVASAGEVALEHQLSASEDLASFMQKREGYVLRPDSNSEKSFSTEIVQDISKLKASLIIPLTHQNNMVGILSLGKKKSDEEFTQDDIDILLPLAKTLSIAITNAQLFEQLSEAHAQAAQREKMAVIGTLSAGINHEICNPLGIARGQCEMFLLNLAEGIYKDKPQDELLDKAKEIMEKVINETDRATVITRKLSSFAKPAKGKVEDDIQVEKELEEVISLVEHDLKLDNIQVVKEFEKNLPPIEADRKQVQEIFFNIIRNAAQSIKGNGKITIRASNKNKKVTVGIEDTGEGITKNNLDRIFNPFYTTKEPGKGTGLGLFIVKQIVERNKGRISVESEPGEGTTFTVEFSVLGSAQVA